MSVIYDAGALLAADRRDRHMWALHEDVLLREHVPLVPAPVLAQAWRGGPQPRLSRLLASCAVVPMTETLAREAGRVCARSKSSDVVDAMVVVIALSHGAPVLTSDPNDLLQIASALRRRLDVLRV